MTTLLHDLRYAVRMLLKQPGFTLVAILALALGIGANTAIFSVVNAVLLRPLNFPEPEGLVAVWKRDTSLPPAQAQNRSTISYPDFEDWRAQNRVFEGVAVYQRNSFTLVDGREAMHVPGALVSAELFKLLRVQPILGRAFLPTEDEPGSRVVMLSHALWQRRFGGDAAVLGRALTLDGRSYQVVGVMPAGFSFPIQTDPIELWTTVAAEREAPSDGTQPVTEQRGNDFLSGIARLRPGVNLAQAQANLDQIAAALAKQYPDSNTHTGVSVDPLLLDVVGNVRPALIVLLGAAACVLLIACVNVANLLLARATTRGREIAIRAALGAGRGRIVAQLLTESLLLALLGGAVGWLLALWGTDAIRALLPAKFPRASEIALDSGVLAFTMIVTLLTGLIFGLAPAWRASRPDLTGPLMESGGGGRGATESARGRRLRGALVVAEIALALVLLSSAGLLIQSFFKLQQVNPGFDARNVLAVKFSLPDSTYPDSVRTADFCQRFADRVSALPGVRSASIVTPLPLSGQLRNLSFQIEEHPVAEAQKPTTDVYAAGLNYFRTMSIPLLRGRDFTTQDTLKSPFVVIVNETFARRFFPGEDPIGKRVSPDGSTEPGPPGAPAPVREIVGVVPDVKARTLDSPPRPQMYLPHAQYADHNVALVTRADHDPRALLPALRAAVAELDSTVPLYAAQPMENYVALGAARPRFNAVLLSIFAAVALTLTAIGIYGVMAYSVAQRTQEIGIRMALGAQKGDVFRLVVGGGLRLVVAGVVIGVLAALALTRLLASLLYGVNVADAPTLSAVVLLLGFVALLACWLPARRAAGVDPAIALREG